MANRWNIPRQLERWVIARDQSCVYCGIAFGIHDAPRREKPSWEHIVNDARMVTTGNIALCCVGCNASKGSKDVLDWFASDYCKRRGINRGSVAGVIQDFLQNRPEMRAEGT